MRLGVTPGRLLRAVRFQRTAFCFIAQHTPSPSQEGNYILFYTADFKSA